MSGKGKELNAQLFIEGRQVPFSSATVNFVVGQPSTMTLRMVPLRELRSILPRTMVHLFVRDQSFPGTYKPWVLLYEGEIYGYGNSKNSSNTSLDLYCMGLSNYWDNAKQYYMNLKTSFGDTLATLQSQKSATEAKRDQMDVKLQESTVQAYLTRVVDNSLKEGKDFLSAIIKIVEEIKEVNSFFKFNNRRYRINDRIVFKSSGKIQELYDFQNKNNLIDQLVGRGNGGIVTIRDIIESLMGLVFHDFVSVPAPSKVTTDNLKGSKKGIGKGGEKTIGSFIFKPNMFLLPPPRCNVLFPDQYDSASFSRNFFHEVTRLKLQPNIPGLQINNTAEAQVFRDTIYAPSGFEKYQTGANETDTSNRDEMFEGPDQGVKGSNSEGVTKTSNTLQDFNFLSYEEILKGIFPELGNTIPSAQIFTKSGKYEENYTYYKRAADFLFHKKRLASRRIPVSGPLNLAPVPGFPILVLDNSPGEFHTVGVLEQISHSISATQGGYTTYQIGFARDVEEKDLWDGNVYEPPIPPFYDEEIFGKRRPVESSDYTALPKNEQSRVSELNEINDFGNSGLNEYYQSLLGETEDRSHLGSSPITSKKHPTLIGATLDLMNQYRAAVESDRVSRFIDTQTRRDYVTLEENFEFLGADNSKFKKKNNVSPTFYADLSDLIFGGGTFDGDYLEDTEDKNTRDDLLINTFKEAIKKRREPINAYRERLRTERGFRG